MKKGVSFYMRENRAKAIHYALYTAKGFIVAILGRRRRPRIMT